MNTKPDASSHAPRSAAPVERAEQADAPAVNWNPWIGVVFVVLAYYISQVISELTVSIYPALRHWSGSQTADWLQNSIYGQFFFVLLAEGLILGGLYMFLRHYKRDFKTIGLKKPRWVDPLYGLAAAPAYYIAYLIVVTAASHYFTGLNVDQQQDIGFTHVSGALEMVLTFISLVVLPPLAEEIMVRGFLYSSLKKITRLVPAAIITSLIFAAAHLPEGGAAGPLYVAAIDTFVLSLFLIYLREKTGSLWASITLHALKNGVAFVALFVLHVH
jgi:membrane protease YdiL (CAAX protease family)